MTNPPKRPIEPKEFKGKAGYCQVVNEEETGFTLSSSNMNSMSGYSGKSGYSGTSGKSGYSGISASGISGHSGFSGYSGIDGGGSNSGIVNVVTDYSADNTGITDATAAINSAINNGTKFKIYLPEGTYLITSVYLKANSGTNKQGVQLIDNIEFFGDKVGKTIIKLQNATTATTDNSYFYPIINGFSASNCIIHDIEIDGNKSNQGNYLPNPYVNPAGYYTDPTKRWSTSDIMFMNGDNNEVYNVYAHDSQLNGIYFYNCTNSYTHHCNTSNNGSSGVTYHVDSDGIIENVFSSLNNSDQIRVDDCSTLTQKTIRNCTASFSGSNADAPNWMAGIFLGGTTTQNVLIEGNHVHDNSAYGVDTGTITSKLRIIGNIIEANGNGGIVTSAGAIISNNNIINNGKKTNGSTDTHSNYNPAAIVLNSASSCVIQGNKAINTNSSQIYFIKSWGGGGSTGFNSSIVSNNYVYGVADVAHLFDGDNGTNIITQHQAYNASGDAIIGNAAFGSNANVLADKYFTFNGSVATGDTTTSFRVGSNNSSDGVCNVYNNSSTAKLLQFGGLALSLLGSYNLKTWATSPNLGSALSGTQTSQLTSSTGDMWMNGSLSLGSSSQDSKAILNLVSTTKGILIPRMTNTQRDAIPSPPEALLIYSLTDHAYEYYNGTSWKQIATV